MSERHLSPRPHRVLKDKEMWWYEEKGGIYLYCATLDKTRRGIIPWRSVRLALKRLDKKP